MGLAGRPRRPRPTDRRSSAPPTDHLAAHAGRGAGADPVHLRRLAADQLHRRGDRRARAHPAARAGARGAHRGGRVPARQPRLPAGARTAGLAASTAPAADTMRALLGPSGGTFIAAGHRDLDVRLSRPRDPGDAARAAGDGGGRRLLSVTGAAAPAISGRRPGPSCSRRCGPSSSRSRGTFGQLVDYVSFGDWIFFGLTVAGLYRLRALDARAGVALPPRGVRVPGYPWTPAVFVAAVGPGRGQRGAGESRQRGARRRAPPAGHSGVSLVETAGLGRPADRRLTELGKVRRRV